MVLGEFQTVCEPHLTLNASETLPSNRYFHKFESYSPHPRFPKVDVSEHGSSGPMTIGYNAYVWKGSEMFIQACANAGIPFSADFNTSRGTLGVNKVRTTFLHVRTGLTP